MFLLLRLIICLCCAGFLLYKYIDKFNELTELRLSIPIAAKELEEIREENVELKYSLDQFETPAHLLELASQPEFAHLKNRPYE